MDTPIANLQPPYLHYEVAGDLIKIQEKIKELILVSKSLIPIKTKLDPSISTMAEKIDLKVISKNFEALNTANLQEITIPNVNRTAVAGVEISPNGKVNMGFNCKKTFTVSNNFGADTCYWEIHFKNLATGLYDRLQFMGGSYTKKSHKHCITFDIDFATYNQAAYVSSSIVLGGINGLATFKVFCMGYNHTIPIINSSSSTLPGPQCYSEEITLDFNGEHCIIINSLSLSADTFKGGKNDKEPTLTVYVSAPAPPSGLTVALSVSNSDLGNIMGSGSFIIPAGQSSGSQSWFLGTRRVYRTGRKFNIIAKLSFHDGSTSPEAYAEITLNKQ
jgi:hypothetical protein